MSGVGQCPGCGAPLEFRVATSIVVVCPFCQQVVARAGADVADLGKSNPVLALPSLFSVGAGGTFRGRSFVVVGRCQLKHSLGGHWNEWYALLDNNKWIWIAEHQGRLAVLGEVSAAQAPGIRTLDAAEPGSRWLSGRGEVIVAERGVAVVHAEEGELPWRAAPNERRAYVDLSAHGGNVATLDFGAVTSLGGGDDQVPKGPIRYFVGFEVSAADLAIRESTTAPPPEAQLPKLEGSQLVNCPKCSAPLTLKRPGDTMTIVCESCGSALSVDDGAKLGFLFAQTIGIRPRIPLGARARFDNELLINARPQDKQQLDVEVVAFVVRSVIEDGETFFFYEYLLATKNEGFRWLVESDGEWWLFKPINAGDVTQQGGIAKYQGANFTRTASSSPQVEQVLGELFWRVNKGDHSEADDFTRSKYKLSVERTRNEVNWTYGFPIPRGSLERVFGVKLPYTPPVSMSSPYDSSDYDSDDHGYSSGYSAGGSGELSPEMIKVILIIGVIILVVFILPMCGLSGGGGGGHGSYGGGGGFSFGK